MNHTPELQEADSRQAPSYYGSFEATAWANGYNAAIRKLAAFPALVAACRAALDDLFEWHSNANMRGDGVPTTCEGCETCSETMPQLRDALVAAGEGEPQPVSDPHEFIQDMRQDWLA